jgi:hypothetical protein
MVKRLAFALVFSGMDDEVRAKSPEANGKIARFTCYVNLGITVPPFEQDGI